ncbi:Hypothetical protein NTJ_12945 [Nesidiocoris tenuis]|uniref:Uncharacterized protein n=1 Tax=Nesidiocoris tenuis TaxID=355587 RepID=A0ABN7B777_9HEMI|nr:Hypothetical protein NTJ_12945 [Nesidiocoris tenuis]
MSHREKHPPRACAVGSPLLLAPARRTRKGFRFPPTWHLGSGLCIGAEKRQSESSSLCPQADCSSQSPNRNHGWGDMGELKPDGAMERP